MAKIKRLTAKLLLRAIIEWHYSQPKNYSRGLKSIESGYPVRKVNISCSEYNHEEHRYWVIIKVNDSFIGGHPTELIMEWFWKGRGFVHEDEVPTFPQYFYRRLFGLLLNAGEVESGPDGFENKWTSNQVFLTMS